MYKQSKCSLKPVYSCTLTHSYTSLLLYSIDTSNELNNKCILLKDFFDSQAVSVTSVITYDAIWMNWAPITSLSGPQPFKCDR